MTDDQTPDLAARLAELDATLTSAIRDAWARIRPALGAAAEAFVLVPNDVDEDETPFTAVPFVPAMEAEPLDSAEAGALLWLAARAALRACLDGDDQAAAQHLDGLDAAQLYAIEAAASGLAIHASRLRKPLAAAEYAAAEQAEGRIYASSRTTELRDQVVSLVAFRTIHHNPIGVADEVMARLLPVLDEYAGNTREQRQRAEQAEARLTEVEKHARDLLRGCPWSGNEPQAGETLLGILGKAKTDSPTGATMNRMSDYDGPATLIADGDTEIPVTVRLWVEAEPVPSSTVGEWRGLIKATEPIVGRFGFPLRLRLPDGIEVKVYAVSGDGSSPARLEIQGTGVPPWRA